MEQKAETFFHILFEFQIQQMAFSPTITFILQMVINGILMAICYLTNEVKLFKLQKPKLLIPPSPFQNEAAVK